jgi:uncharacterized damage-inducible protein DinB
MSEQTAEPTTPRPEDSETARDVIDAARAILEQGEDMLGRLDSKTFSTISDVAFKASIGGHYRHCLDHFTAFLRALDSNFLDYDQRDRDPRIETDSQFALEETRRIRKQFDRLAESALQTQIVCRCQVHYDLPSPECDSTLGRELVYVVAHAIHHYALISVLARLSDIELPAHFGVAPSTVAYETSR